MSGKGKGSRYSVAYQEQYKRRRDGDEEPEYVEGIETALKIAGLA